MNTLNYKNNNYIYNINNYIYIVYEISWAERANDRCCQLTDMSFSYFISRSVLTFISTTDHQPF
jgi:hypothetical protein